MSTDAASPNNTAYQEKARETLIKLVTVLLKDKPKDPVRFMNIEL
jgi:hypothetical protein